LVALGIAFAANLGAHLETTLVPGESISFAGQEITYESPFQETHPNKTTRGVRLSVTKDNRLTGHLEPSANFCVGSAAGISTPDKLSSPKGDLYATLLKLDSESATLTFDTSPLIWLLWLGGLVTAAGGIWAMMSRRQERITDAKRQTVDV
jgi:cytochrome c-type biogenesis protein CcmF